MHIEGLVLFILCIRRTTIRAHKLEELNSRRELWKQGAFADCWQFSWFLRLYIWL